jgi:DNA polymerase-1
MAEDNSPQPFDKLRAAPSLTLREGAEVKKLVLVDGHAMLYRAWFAFPKNLTKRDGTIINAVYGFTRILLNVIDEMKPEYLAVSFDVGRTFRHEQCKEYKAHREKMPDELKEQEPIVNEVLQALNVPVVTKNGFEADDVIGTLAQQASSYQLPVTSHQLTTIIVTGDKDTLQLVQDPLVKVYMPGRMNKPAILYNEAAVVADLGVTAAQIADFKGLAGDSSDNIPGVYGIGKVTAAKLLKQYGTVEGVYEHLSEIGGVVHNKLEAGRESAIESRRLATIVTEVPIKLDLEACTVKEYDKERALKLFEALGFQSLMRKLPNDAFEEEVQQALF